MLNRVTGNNLSDIQGTLGTFRPIDGRVRVPEVNLFLANPNGIVFGENVSLDVGGSFFATTANGVQFGERGFFSATQPEVPSALLTIEPNAFFFNAIAKQAGIEVRSRATQTVLERITTGLRVPNGQNLVLLGGNVNVAGGLLNAYSDRVEIGAVSGPGTMGLSANGSLQFADSVLRGNVSFTRAANTAAEIDVRLDPGGDIGITARNISVSGGSLLLAGIFSRFGAVGDQAGNITLDATGEVRVEQASRIGNLVPPNAIGNASNLSIRTLWRLQVAQS